MSNPLVERLRQIVTFPQLVKYLRDELDWPIEQDKFDDIVFDWDAEELGLDPKSAAKISEIKQLRPLTAGQPWGIFFVKFEPKRLPIVALRRILSQLVIKKRASARKADQQTWRAQDLLFISAHGAGGERQLTFAHFSEPRNDRDLPTLRVLGWDGDDTALHLDHVARTLDEKLVWPANAADIVSWPELWSSAFVLRPREVIQTSKQLAIRLADLARGIRDRARAVLEMESERGKLRRIHKAFRAALIHDLSETDFADMYAQTITYGLFSAAVSGEGASKRSNLIAADVGAQVPVTNPFLRDLLGSFLEAGGRNGKIDFDELGVQDVVDLLNSPDTHLDAVLRDFGNKARDEDPVIHFYESFLREYDAAKKISRGVFYTPQPVVSYIVRSLDELLRTEFGLADGLADTTTWGEMAKRQGRLQVPPGVDPTESFVQILDPATGTGTFLVEVIDSVHRTMMEKWRRQGHEGDAASTLWNDYVANHLLPCLHGYELLMAPYAIAHLKIGLKLHETGYLFATEERARIFLTNTLEPPIESKRQIEFKEWIPALAHEAHAVNEIKQNRRFTVVTGNPPYSGVSSNMTDFAQQLVEEYKTVDGQPLGERKVWLQDDYVKFIRFAQLSIDRSGAGALGYITNHGYLDNPTFRGMRQSLLRSFELIRVIDLHGNAAKKEQPPDGADDKNVFDIQQGVAVCLAATPVARPRVEHMDLWGTREEKYSRLNSRLPESTSFSSLSPDSPYYLFEPQNIDSRDEYNAGWKINDAMPFSSAGFITARDSFVTDIAKTDLQARINDFANSSISDAEIRSRYFAGRGSDKYPDGDTRGWKVPTARQVVRADSKRTDRIRECLYRPFDKRWVYWHDAMIDWPRPELQRRMLGNNTIALMVCRQSGPDGWRHVLVGRGLIESCFISNRTREIGYVLPLRLSETGSGLFEADASGANFHPEFVREIATRMCSDSPNKGVSICPPSPEDLLAYIYAVFHSPTYRERYAEFLKIDFPRVPLPGNSELFADLVQVGSRLVAIHLMQSGLAPQPVTTYIGLTRPLVERVGWCKGTLWLDSPSETKPGTRGFRGVSEAVWNFQIGGYQVCQKWLKDRKGRTLTKDEISHYEVIVSTLAETIRIMKKVDEVIDKHGGWPRAFAHLGHTAADTLLTKVAEQPPQPYGTGSRK